MKKAVLLILSVLLICMALPVSAAKISVNGNEAEGDIVFFDSTAYVSVEEMAKMLNLTVDYDEKTDSVFVNGIDTTARKGKGTTLYVNGLKYTPTDLAAKYKVIDSKLYLPAHIAAEAFSQTVEWSDETKTLKFTKNEKSVNAIEIDENKTYAIINAETGKAITAGDMDISTNNFTRAKNQKFQFVKSEVEGYYHIRNVATGKNLDVYNHGTTPGVKIIVWDQGAGDNQKFSVEFTSGGAIISARSCHLPIEDYEGGILQNAKHDGDNQKWLIVEFNKYEKSQEKAEKLVIEYTE